MVKAVLKKAKNDNELSQALSRVTISPSIFLISAFLTQFMGYDLTFTMIASGFHTLYSVFIFFNILRYPRKFPFRKFINIIADLGLLNLVIYFEGIKAIFLYPIILWIIVGNGVRFGIKYFYTALFFGVLFFASATYFNSNWHSHKELSISLTIGLIILTLFYTSLIKKLHYLNETLEDKVKERTKELKHRLYYDSLTNLKNRYSLTKYLEKYNFFVLILIDISGFKNYNDIYGVEIGNEILKRFAYFLKSFYKRKPYEVYRVYADGFAVVGVGKHIDMQTYERDLMEFFENLDKFSIKLISLKDEIKIDVSMGITFEKDHALEKADMALTYAKKRRRKYVIYDESIDTTKQCKNTLFWKREIKKAIERDNIVPLFQPIVDGEGEIVKYESLMRLKRIKENGEEELVSPFFFLDVAIKTNLYEKLTISMIEKSFSMMKELGSEFSINLSFDDIANRDVIFALKEAIIKYEIGNLLILEIVESSNVEDYALIKEFVKDFRKFGVRIAIDDFGSGFSNYSHILEISPDILKIDGSLIKNIHENRNSYILVKSIVSLAKSLNIKTVAEFVHSKEVFDIAKDLGVDYFQGFYFSPPLSFEKLRSNFFVSV